MGAVGRTTQGCVSSEKCPTSLLAGKGLLWWLPPLLPAGSSGPVASPSVVPTVGFGGGVGGCGRVWGEEEGVCPSAEELNILALIPAAL